MLMYSEFIKVVAKSDKMLEKPSYFNSFKNSTINLALMLDPLSNIYAHVFCIYYTRCENNINARLACKLAYISIPQLD